MKTVRTVLVGIGAAALALATVGTSPAAAEEPAGDTDALEVVGDFIDRVTFEVAFDPDTPLEPTVAVLAEDRNYEFIAEPERSFAVANSGPDEFADGVQDCVLSGDQPTDGIISYAPQPLGTAGNYGETVYWLHFKERAETFNGQPRRLANACASGLTSPIRENDYKGLLRYTGVSYALTNTTSTSLKSPNWLEGSSPSGSISVDFEIAAGPVKVKSSVPAAGSGQWDGGTSSNSRFNTPNTFSSNNVWAEWRYDSGCGFFTCGTGSTSSRFQTVGSNYLLPVGAESVSRVVMEVRQDVACQPTKFAGCGFFYFDDVQPI